MIVDIAICSDNERLIQFKLQLLSKGIAKCISHTLNIRAINSQNTRSIRVYCVLHHVQHMYVDTFTIHVSACILGNVICERPLIDRFCFHKLIL